MVKYARGDRAWGTCARGGHRLLLRDMVSDPRTGLLVDPSWAEDPEPKPLPKTEDGIALHRIAPDLDAPQTIVYLDESYDRATGYPAPPLSLMYAFDSPTIAVT